MERVKLLEKIFNVVLFPLVNSARPRLPEGTLCPLYTWTQFLTGLEKEDPINMGTLLLMRMHKPQKQFTENLLSVVQVHKAKQLEPTRQPGESLPCFFLFQF